MKYPRKLRAFHWAWRLGLLGLGLASCNTDESSPNDSGGSAGRADKTELTEATGDGGADAAAPAPVRLCGAEPKRSLCDPVTAAPCDILAGETCDYYIPESRFQCFPGPNPVEPGGACDVVLNFCAAGASCNIEIARCQRYCCKDSDCTEGSCQTEYRKDGAASIGVCLGEYRGSGGNGAGGSNP